jgi:hypothetical protein
LSIELLALAFFVSLFTTLVLIRYQHLHEKVTSEFIYKALKSFTHIPFPELAAWVYFQAFLLMRGLHTALCQLKVVYCYFNMLDRDWGRWWFLDLELPKGFDIFS